MSNWRSQIRANQRKTVFIMLSFLGLYFLMGWLLVAIISPHPNVFSLEQLSDIDNQATIILFLIIASIIISVSVLFGAKLSLSGTKPIKVTENSKDYKQLYHIVEEMKIASGLRFMPKIYVLRVDYHNAFASGWSQNDAIIAVSKPLLNLLNREELQAVVAHELSHIKHQDTRVMTVVSICANMLVVLIDAMCRSLTRDSRRSKKKDEDGGLLLIVVIALRLILPILTLFMVMYTSRKREYLADAGCVKLTRNPLALAKALRKIHEASKGSKDAYDIPYEGYRSMAYIYSPKEAGVYSWFDTSTWFSTHPKLEDRLRALGIINN